MRGRTGGGRGGGEGGGGSSERGDGVEEGDQRPLPDAVDAPLRTVSIDVLKKVAIKGFKLAYR